MNKVLWSVSVGRVELVQWNFPGWSQCHLLLRTRTQAQSSLWRLHQHTGIHSDIPAFPLTIPTTEILPRSAVRSCVSNRKSLAVPGWSFTWADFPLAVHTAQGVCIQQCKHSTFLPCTDNQDSNEKRVLNPEQVQHPRSYTHLPFTQLLALSISHWAAVASLTGWVRNGN